MGIVWPLPMPLKKLLLRISKILLTELRNGQLGRLTLETPEMTEREWLQVIQRREEKAAKKAARKNKR